MFTDLIGVGLLTLFIVLCPCPVSFSKFQLANGIWELQTSPLEWLRGPTLKSL